MAVTMNHAPPGQGCGPLCPLCREPLPLVEALTPEESERRQAEYAATRPKRPVGRGAARGTEIVL
jgi:hypothetical protein